MPTTESGYGWTLGANLSETRHLVERLGFSPTVRTTGSSVIIDRYKYALLIGVLLLLAAVFYSFAVSRTVARRTKKLVEVIDEKSELEKTARIDRERLSQLERAGFVSEISSMIAHELRQPVASLINYADGLSLYLACLGLDAGAHFFETVMRPEGALWVGIGFLITFIPVVIMALVSLRLCKMDFGNTCGMLCGSMANPMALNYANDIIPGDEPSVSYATVYPLGMFTRVIIAQLLLMLFL